MMLKIDPDCLSIPLFFSLCAMRHELSVIILATIR